MAMTSAKKIRRMPFVSMRSECRQLPKEMLLSLLSHGENSRPSRGRNKFLRDRLQSAHCAASTGWSAIVSTLRCACSMPRRRRLNSFEARLDQIERFHKLIDSGARVTFINEVVQAV